MNKLGYAFAVYEKRRDELIREAQQHRLVKEARNATAQQPYHARFLASVGSHLIKIGNTLEYRYKQCAQLEDIQMGIKKGYQT